MIRILVCLFVFCVGPVAATSPTLTLEAVFARSEVPWTPPQQWRTSDPDGPPFEAPAAEMFHVEPSPTPSPTGTPEPVSEVDQMMAQIGHVASRIEGGRRVTQKESKPLLEEQGRILSTEPRGAIVEVVNEFRELCVRLTFEPENGDEPFVLLLGPETSDEFDLPPGEYNVIRESWTENGEGLVREEFPVQPLKESWRYRIEQTASEERRLIRQGGRNFT
ncbi:hypothetical protein KQI84_04815 [bacterium]|nr:hypothetical protein [bacterium]